MSAATLGAVPRPRPAPERTPATVHSLDEARHKAKQRARARHLAQIRRARVDPVAFAEYVMVDEKTQRPITLADFHKEWHSYWSAHDWSVLVAPVEHGKTMSLVSRLLWEMGRNPDVRIAWISAAESQAKDVLGIIKRYIESSPRLREVFPGLHRSTRKQHRWNMHEIEIERSPYLRQPTVHVYGAGTEIAGARLDIIVLDDVLNIENTNTLEAAQKTIKWFDTLVLTRAQDQADSGQAARIWVIGTPFADFDLLAELPKRGSFVGRTYSAVQNPDDKPAKWLPTWPRVWPLKRLLKRLNGILPSAFARTFLCRITNDINSRFPDWAIKRAFIAGRGLTILNRRPLMWPGPRALPCWTGVDLGVGKKEGNDLTALVTMALREDMRRQVVKIEAGRWTADEIVERLVDNHHRYDSRLIVENNAAQDFLLQFTRKLGKIPVKPFTTDAFNKWDEAFGIESIAVELRQGLYLFPSGEDGATIDDELHALRLEMVSYRPRPAHTGNRLMALWFAREGIRATTGRRHNAG